jgi:DNA ligase-1
MKRFAQLIDRLDETTSTTRKVEALRDYLAEAPDNDKLWTIALLSHRRPKRTVRTAQLREWAAEEAGIPLWLFEDSYHVVGDLGETIALLVPGEGSGQERSLTEHIELIIGLKDVPDDVKRQRITEAWRNLDRTARFVFNKLITGGFRIGVSQKLMVRALGLHTGIGEDELAHLLMGNWDPQNTTFAELTGGGSDTGTLSRPYPFYLAYALETPVHELGDPRAWLVERKWDGIRGQLIVRRGQLYVWSRGEELVTDKFPEYQVLRTLLPSGTVVDGEILPFRDGRPLPFQVLQTRIGRTNVTPKVLKDAPVVLLAYDLLEWKGEDLRERPLSERRALLEQVVMDTANDKLLLSQEVKAGTWEGFAAERAVSRELMSEGLMLKHRDSAYRVGRKKGDWWKWKVDPLTIDGVLIYAQRGHGRRADLFTDFTFAVWNGDELVPFTKAYSGLTDKEMNRIDAYVKANTIDKFGPVRSVTPMHVFELAFEGIQRSPRHKSGVALRFPRILRWREDKALREANTLQDLHQLLNAYENTGG